MFRLGVLIAALTAALGVSAAQANERYAELNIAKLKLLGTLRADPGLGLWGDQTHASLMGMIEGTWTDVGYADMSTADKFAEYCQKFAYKIKKLNDYTFEMVLPAFPQNRKHEFRQEYILKSGLVYNIRRDIVNQMKIHGDYGPNVRLVLNDANMTSTLMVLSPNVVLEVGLESGLPTLWGRCPY
jgi:hypothetical protein